MYIDKSKFTADELAQYEALIAKGMVDDAEVETEPETYPEVSTPTVEKSVEEVEKSFEIPDFITAAIAKSNEFMERIEKKEMAEVAKKYALLDVDMDKLTDQLYELKKSAPAAYQTCISMLDSQVNLIEKSGLYDEIGKSGRGESRATGSTGLDAKVSEIMKSAPDMGYYAAYEKAVMENPDLADEYDNEYFG